MNSRAANVEQTKLSTRTQIDAMQAQLETAQAALKTADLNLEYATIKAPIGGRVGDSLAQIGGLVTSNSVQPLTTIVPLDPIWVRFKVSEAEYLKLAVKPGQNSPRRCPSTSCWPTAPSIHLKEKSKTRSNQVDPKTGTLELQATFPNPQHKLLPGQFGRVRTTAEQLHGAILIPQRSVQDLQGLQSVFVVGADNKVQARDVQTGERSGDLWIIKSGLKPGDRVIVEGLQKVRTGAIVNPIPYQGPAAGTGR